MSEPSSWSREAACRDMDPNLFFVGQGGIIGQEVRAACRQCVVRRQCLSWALNHEQFGYWAGTSDRMRRRMRQELGISLHRPEATLALLVDGHGTDGAYQRHLRNAEKPCDACVDAHRAAKKNYSEQKEDAC